MLASLEQLNQAICMAKTGQDVQARQLFQAIVEQDPDCAPAWVWLSGLLTRPEQQINALENALKALPVGAVEDSTREAVETRLERLYQTHPYARQAPSGEVRAALEQKLEQARSLVRGGMRADALRLAQEVAETNPRDEGAWELISILHPDPAIQYQAAEQMAAIDPDNEAAQRRMSSLAKIQKDPLKRGRYLEELGQSEQAIDLYVSLIAHSRSPVERIEAQQRINQINLRQESDQIQPVKPNLNLLRLTFGPVLLFALMVYMQSGLNLPHISLLACPGVICVLAGSLVISATDMRPIHPLWVRFFGVPGSGDEPEMRRGLRLLGLALILAPFTMFLIEAGYRLGVLQASILSRLR